MANQNPQGAQYQIPIQKEVLKGLTQKNTYTVIPQAQIAACGSRFGFSQECDQSRSIRPRKLPGGMNKVKEDHPTGNEAKGGEVECNKYQSEEESQGHANEDNSASSDDKHHSYSIQSRQVFSL